MQNTRKYSGIYFNYTASRCIVTEWQYPSKSCHTSVHHAEKWKFHYLNIYKYT